MIEKPDYIKGLENEGKPFSIMRVVLPKGFDDFMKSRSVDLVLSESYLNFLDNKIHYRNKIYLTKQSFYLYLSLEDTDNEYLTIYYKENQLNELTIFITQLLKTYKNGTTNNK